MRFEEVRKVFAAWNPSSYRKQIAVKKKVLVKRLFFGIVLSLLFMLVVSLPLLFKLSSNIEKTAEYFEELNVSVELETSESVELSKLPPVIVDSERENMSKEKVLINKEGITINRPLWIDDKVYSWSSLQSAQNIVKEYKGIFIFTLILLIPSLLITLIILAGIETFVLLALSIVLTKVFCILQVRQKKILRGRSLEKEVNVEKTRSMKFILVRIKRQVKLIKRRAMCLLTSFLSNDCSFVYILISL